MARPLRIEYEGALYHVTARGNERRKIFFTKSDYSKFLEYIENAIKKHGMLLHAYILMSNHYHLIIETPQANLSKVMHYINGSYTTYINTKRKRSGHLFQGRYKAILVSKDNYLAELSRYIHLNPVRAKMIEKPEDYEMSSYKAYITDEKEKRLTKDLILGLISSHKGEAKKKYRLFVESSIGKKLENPLDNVYGGIILGGTRFIKETLRKIKKEYLEKEGITRRRALRSAYDKEEIIETTASHFKIKKEDIADRKYSEQRKIAIYLMKDMTGASNREIGNLFGGMSYSAVAKSYERFGKEISRSRKLKRELNRLKRKLSNVKP